MQLSLVLAAAVAGTAALSPDADSQLVRCRVSQEQVDAFMATKSRLNLDVWDQRLGSVDVRVPMGAKIDPQFDCSVHVASVNAAIQSSQRGSVGEGQEDSGSWFDRYHRYGELVGKLEELAAAHPKHMKLVRSIGKSAQGRDIPVAIISRDISTESAERVWINGGQHAREWASPATVMVIVKNLLEHYRSVQLGEAQSTEEAASLKGVEFHIAPLINPDGYEYTHTHDRMWRKNRRDNGDGTMGVDLNRNWPNHWSRGSGSSQEDFQGSGPASEPEVQAVMKYFKQNKQFTAGLDYHSYGKLILRSPGWRRGDDKDEPMLRRLGEAMAVATKKGGGGSYTSERAAELYPCTGAMDDFMSENMKMWAHGWTVELPGNHHQFMLPERDIHDTAKGAYKGMVGFVKQIHQEKLLRDAKKLSESKSFADDKVDVVSLSDI